MTISTCSPNTNFDTANGVYANSNCFDYAACLEGGSNDNCVDCTLTGTGASLVEFDSTSGQEHNFYVSDASGRLDGAFGLTVSVM